MSDTFKKFDEFLNIDESVKFKYEGINFNLRFTIADNSMWVQALPASSKDLDKIDELDLQDAEIGDYIAIFVKKKSKLNGSYDSSHPGAGYWVKISESELEKLFK